MSESFVQVTEGTGKKLHTKQRTIGANLVEDEIVVLGEPYLPGYTVEANNISAAAAGHIIQIMAGASLKVRIRSISIDLSAATAAGRLVLGLKRLTTAGSGGVGVTPSQLDPADAAAGATAQTLPTALGTISGGYFVMPVFQTNAANPQPSGQRFTWTRSPHQKPLIIPAGAANGLALIIVSTVAGSTVNAWIEFDESSF